METTIRKVTIIYYRDVSLELMHETVCFPQNNNGRVIISEEFKQGKSIIAVCEGEVNILNKIGDRVESIDVEDEA